MLTYADRRGLLLGESETKRLEHLLIWRSQVRAGRPQSVRVSYNDEIEKERERETERQREREERNRAAHGCLISTLTQKLESPFDSLLVCLIKAHQHCWHVALLNWSKSESKKHQSLVLKRRCISTTSNRSCYNTRNISATQN